MRRVVFVWAVRDAGKVTATIHSPIVVLTRARTEHLQWISKVLNEALAAAQSTSLAIEPHVYITGPTCTIPEAQRTVYAPSDGTSTPPSPADIGKFEKELPVYSSLKITHGRPSIRRVLQESIDSSTGPVSVDGQYSLLPSLRPVLIRSCCFSRWPFVALCVGLAYALLEAHQPDECAQGRTLGDAARRDVWHVHLMIHDLMTVLGAYI